MDVKALKSKLPAKTEGHRTRRPGAGKRRKTASIATLAEIEQWIPGLSAGDLSRVEDLVFASDISRRELEEFCQELDASRADSLSLTEALQQDPPAASFRKTMFFYKPTGNEIVLEITHVVRVMEKGFTSGIAVGTYK